MSTATEHVNGTEVSGAEAWARAGVADAEAEAIRARTAADVEAKRIAAEAAAEATRIKAREDAEKQRIANERAAMRLEKEKADNRAKIAEANRRERAANRAAEDEQKAADAADEEKATAEVAVATATNRWRLTAKGFYALCAAVALPVQIAAFYREDAKYLVIAPVFIELIALVALVGAAAAVTAGRPQWHYRTVAWAGALTAATINVVHGLEAFDPATAFGTALASIAGPGMWDLHEHGRIAERDGKQTWRQRRAAKKAAKAEVAERAAEERRRAEREAHEAEAAREAAEQLALQRAEGYPEIWAHAQNLAAALGETTVTEDVWWRAHEDIEGAPPGWTADIIRNRNKATRRVAAATSEAPGGTPVKVTNAQAVPQMPTRRGRGAKGGPKVRGTRRPGDTAKYSPGARKQASITAKNASGASDE